MFRMKLKVFLYKQLVLKYMYVSQIDICLGKIKNSQSVAFLSRIKWDFYITGIARYQKYIQFCQHLIVVSLYKIIATSCDISILFNGIQQSNELQRLCSRVFINRIHNHRYDPAHQIWRQSHNHGPSHGIIIDIMNILYMHSIACQAQYLNTVTWQFS